MELNRNQLDQIINGLPALVSYVSKDLRYIYLNKGYQDWFGERVRGWQGQPIREVLAQPVYAVIEPHLRQALQGELSVFDLQLPYRGGEMRQVLVRYIPDSEPEGRVNGIIALIEDVTEQYQYQDELKKKNRDLLQANADLDSFIYMASHDLKAPINNLAGLLDLLEDIINPETLTNPAYRLAKELMHESISRFNRTIYDLADITKAVSERENATQRFDLEPLLLEVLEDFADELRAARADVHLDVEPGITICFARPRLRSILRNLISNAIRYRHPQRPLRIGISCTHSQKELHLSVQDNGLGIPPDKHQVIFSLFSRLHPHVEGAGIGLYLVRRLVENAGGAISVRSDADRGAIFELVLPRPAGGYPDGGS